MDNIFAWYFLSSGLYLIVLSLIVNAKNIPSSFIFKVIPFFIGVGNLLYSLKLFNFIKIGMF